ncbi:unnamed protein product [Caenorhabditis brenneri]
MKKWRFFPILVKEEVLKNMNSYDRLSLSSYCTTSRSLLGGIPHRLNTVKIADGFFVVDDHLISREVFCSLINRPNSSIRKLSLFVESTADRTTLNEIFGERKLWKVSHLEVRIQPDFYESCKELIELCDPSILKTIVIPRLCTNEVYDSIVNTEQWKNCKKVRLNTDSAARHSSSLQVNYNHFSHFKKCTIGVDSLSLDDAWNLVRKYKTFTEKEGHFYVTTRQPLQPQEVMERIDYEEGDAWHFGDLILAEMPALRSHSVFVEAHEFSFIGVIRHIYHRLN